ncbi:MAG: 30S ribosomal protein S6 [Candidatus Latescibacteria bacterium]|nr:30S ribosomal protein S6 [Candidatus Latescibacterota bacterium]
MRRYEITYVIDSQLTEEEIEMKIKKYEQFLQSRGAEIVTFDRWGLRRLAYDIKKRQQGYYVFLQYQADGRLIREFERELELDEGILRYLTVALTSRLIKEQVA